MIQAERIIFQGNRIDDWPGAPKKVSPQGPTCSNNYNIP
jgi:hypothetical protein